MGDLRRPRAKRPLWVALCRNCFTMLTKSKSQFGDGMTDVSSAEGARVGGDEPSTKELVVMAQNGDREAAEKLFAKSYPDVLQAVRFRLGSALRNRMDTLDLAQSAYHEAFRDLPKYEYKGRGSFRSWLMAIIEHKIRGRLQFFRAQKRDMRRDVALDEGRDVAAEVDSPAQRVLATEDRERLERAMDDLQDDYRDVIVYRYYLQLPWQEVGERMNGRTPEAAQMHCRRALLRLKQLYDAMEHEGSSDEA